MEKTTRQKLIDSYLELGDKNGFDTVSLGSLSKEVGITKSTIFSHFSSSEDLHNAAIDYCTSSIKADSFSVNFRSRDLQDLFTNLINSMTDTFTAFPLNAYLSFLEQKSLTDTDAYTLSDRLNSMLRARILVALDYAVQRSWLSVNNTDAISDILTPFFRRGLTSADESYWDSLMDFLKESSSVLFRE